MLFKVVHTDGATLKSNEKVGPVNLFLQSLLSSSQVTLQNKTSVTCNNKLVRLSTQTMQLQQHRHLHNCFIQMIMTTHKTQPLLVLTMN